MLLLLQITSSLTDEDAARAGAEIRALKARLETSERQKRLALKAAGLSDARRRELRAELEAVREQMRELLRQLESQSIQYAANLRAYREGLTGLLSKEPPPDHRRPEGPRRRRPERTRHPAGDRRDQRRRPGKPARRR